MRSSSISQQEIHAASGTSKHPTRLRLEPVHGAVHGATPGLGPHLLREPSLINIHLPFTVGLLHNKSESEKMSAWRGGAGWRGGGASSRLQVVSCQQMQDGDARVE